MRLKIRLIAKLIIFVFLFESIVAPSLAASAADLSQQALAIQGNLAAGANADSSSMSNFTNIPNSVAAPAQANSANYAFSGPIPSDYEIGPNDSLDLRIIVGSNSMNLEYNLIVNPEGKIYLSGIGEIYINKLTLAQAKAEITRAIKKKFTMPFDLSLMLKFPKKVAVYVTGQTASPGLLTVYDGAHISEVVKASGVKPGGSMRDVVIIRKNQKIKLDLYDVYYKGLVEKDINIQIGDVIEIPISNNIRVTVLGEVSRPGRYELKNNEGMRQALLYAGYVSPSSILSNVAYLKREKGEDDFDFYKYNLYEMFSGTASGEAQDVLMSDGDILTVPAIKNYVYVYGEVGKPGRFEYLPGSKLSDYLNMAGGPTVRASLSRVSISRPITQENSKVLYVNAGAVLMQGKAKDDIEIYGGDVINVPTNFFYFSDVSSFINTILLGLTLYATVRKN